MGINQCDGCRRHLPIIDGVHMNFGYDMIACTADRYKKPEKQCPCQRDCGSKHPARKRK